MPEVHKGIDRTGGVTARIGDLVDQPWIGGSISQRNGGVDGIDDPPDAGDSVVHHGHAVKDRFALFDALVEPSAASA